MVGVSIGQTAGSVFVYLGIPFIAGMLVEAPVLIGLVNVALYFKRRYFAAEEAGTV